MQKVQVKNWGNSKGIRIPKNVLEQLDLKEDSVLEIHADQETGSIVLKVDDGLTPYQRLMARGKSQANRKNVIWDRLEEEKELYN